MANESQTAGQAGAGRGRFLNFIQNSYVAVASVLVIFFLFIPMPKVFVDLCMILNLAFAFIILLVVIFTPRASDFQTFPRVILFQTMFGVAINVSSTVLILRNPPTNANQQSAMVQSFAKIVAGDDVVIGFIIFVILVILQAMVITKGASRISEVAARFSLDSMSQKYFDIDNRLNSGIIDDAEALRLKNAISKEIDFYSNMDGSSKFVSGNVKFGIVVTVVNLLGGLIMGMWRNNLDITQALNTYSRLTIGDGLVSQLPSLIISFATGILVTGTKSDEDLGEQLKSDFTRSGYIYIIVGGVLALTGIALRSGTQWLLLPVGIGFIAVGVRLSRSKLSEQRAKTEQAAQEKSLKQKSKASPDAEKIALLDDMSLELGYALVPLVSEDNGAELLERIVRIREDAKLDMGFVIPKIRILDNITLDPNDYSFKIKGIEAGHANIRLGYYMCMDTGSVINPIQGEKTKDPTFGMDAFWLPEDRRAEAEAAGYVVVDPPTIIATHITEIIRSHAADLINRRTVSSIMDTVKERNEVLVNEVLQVEKIPYGLIEQVLKNLLSENVSIRNIETILETMADYYSISKNPWTLTEKVREALGLQICTQYYDKDDKKLRVMLLSQELSQLALDHAYYPPDNSKPTIAFDAPDRRLWLSSVSAGVAAMQGRNYQPVILCPSSVRQLVHSSIEREMPGVVVISEQEAYAAGRAVSIEPMGEIKEEVA